MLGFLWVVSSLIQMTSLVDYARYQYIFHDNLSYSLIFWRYIGSWAQRFLGLAAGFGLMYHRRWAAVVVNILSVYSILIVFWKHPYEAVKNHCVLLDKQLGWIFTSHGYTGIHFISYVGATANLLRALDVLFFGFMLYYLSRLHIKARLK